VPRPARSVAALTIQRQMKTIFSGPEARGDSSIHMLFAFVRLLAGPQRSKLGGRDVRRCFDASQGAIVPIRAREVDGFGEEGRHFKREIKLSPVPRASKLQQRSGRHRTPATDCPIARTAPTGSRCRRSRPSQSTPCLPEPRLLSSCGINHVAAESNTLRASSCSDLPTSWNPSGFCPGHSSHIFMRRPRLIIMPEIDSVLICDPGIIRTNITRAEGKSPHQSIFMRAAVLLVNS